MAHHRKPSPEAQAQEPATREGRAERDWLNVTFVTGCDTFTGAQLRLVEQAAASIADDPEYQRALREADGMEWSATVAAELIGGFVRDWLRRLL